MKFIMVFYLGLSVVRESGDAYDNYLCAMNVPKDYLFVHRFFVLFIPVCHYMVTLIVILAGVSVILSCQAVPQILACAMAILFITEVDELLWSFFKRLFDVTVVWRIPFNEDEGDENRVQLVLKRCLVLF